MAGKETVLIVDGGGRGSALVDKYAQSEHVGKILAVPGNDLMKLNTNGKEVLTYPQFKTTDISDILRICRERKVGLVDVAQDNAVEVGLVDALRAKSIPVVGPTRAAGRIEWDKIWAREKGEFWGLTQPKFHVCYSRGKALNIIDRSQNQPWFIKDPYLAEGKGALPARYYKEAVECVETINLPKGGQGGFLLEEWLKGDDGSAGEEFSTFILCDGTNFCVLGSAQDHKRAFNFDEGENTGGMGCSSPPLVLEEKYAPGLEKKVKMIILDKVVQGLWEDERPYTGVLYLGGMAVQRNGELDPYVIEWNARWGDPEVEGILAGIQNDWFEVGMAVARGDISKLKIENDGLSRVVVAGASRGYPGNYSEVKGKRVYNLDVARRIEGVKIYGAGVKRVDKKDYAAGGRLFYVVGEGDTVVHAREKAYQAMSLISVESNNLHYRTDIGWRDVERLRQGR